MKVKNKRIIFINFILVFLIVFLIPTVSATNKYEFVDPNNELPVKRERKYIYILADLYYDIVGKNTSNNVYMNYSGACSTVTVDGKTYSLDDYIAGVVAAEMGAEADKPEALKAQAIAARSFLISSKKNSNTCSVGNGQFFQAFKEVDPSNPNQKVYIDAAYSTSGMVVMKGDEVAFTQYSSYSPTNEEKDGKWYVTMYKYGSDSSTSWTWSGASKTEVKNANNYFHSTAGHKNGMSQALAGYLASIGQNYERIIETFYKVDGYSLGVLSDGDYVGDIVFVDSEFGKVRYFNQGNYGSYYYSSNVNVAQYYKDNGSPATIQSHGCGPTAMAIVLSSFAGKDISPITTTQEVCKLGGCYDSGSSFSALKKLAENYGYKTKMTSNPSEVTTALASKQSLVVALMGKGTFTNGGHYIVLTGTRSDGYVSVADPGSSSRTDKKWFSFNLVVEESKADFLIITR